MNREFETKQWYKRYYAQKGNYRNDLRRNSGVLFQALAMEASLIRASYVIEHNPAEASVLDVGCGGGGDIPQLIKLQYLPKNIVGIDIQAERIIEAKDKYPQVRFIHGDASHMELADNSFDLVFESTMFATLPDDTLSTNIAREMVRVCKPEGYLLLVDWWKPKPFDPNYKALTKKRLALLFKVGEDTEIVKICRGALVPPVGRFLSRWLPSMYFLVSALFPFLVGQVAYVLKKKQRKHFSE